MVGKSDAERNMKEFLQKYGEEGFLKLFLTNYLFELINYYLHSEETRKNKEDDPSYLMQVNYKGIPYTPQEIDRFNEAVRRECAKRATAIVEKLKSMDVLSKFVSEPTSDPRLAGLLQDAFQSIVKELQK